MYDKRKDNIICFNLKNTKQSFKIRMTYGNDNTWERGILEAILPQFTINTKYSVMLNIARALCEISSVGMYAFSLQVTDDNKKAIEETTASEVKIENKIDINNASENEIAKLPGVNIVQAKKVIK